MFARRLRIENLATFDAEIENEIADNLMNILITGGAGYVGSALVHRLLAVKEVKSITIFDNLSAKNFGIFTLLKTTDTKVNFVEGDILDAHKLNKEVKKADVVYHLASLTVQNQAMDSHYYEQINHWGTSEVLNAVEQSNVQKFIYVSSAEIFDSGEIENENAKANPKSFYAHSVYRAEEQIKRMWDKKQCYIIRASEIFGYSLANQYVGLLNKFVFQAQFKGRIQIPGNGRNLVSFVSINKTVEVLAQFLNTKAPSEVFHLSDYTFQTLDVVEILQELYPNLEFIFINPHLQLQDLALKPSEKLNSFINLKTNSLKDELRQYISYFSF
ncbi:MAG: NAD-dependent epimerase/dehydratase family protein [Cytophagales bacterium]